MQVYSRFSLKTLNTFQVEAFADRYIRLDEEAEIPEFLQSRSLPSRRFLILGSGSNLLFLNDFNGTIVHPALKGITVLDKNRTHVRVKAMAGENWDDLVAFAVANGWSGLENLSLIPGSVGASAIQNIGAYGVEVKTALDAIEAYCIATGEKVVFYPHECGFDYRYSHFKGRWKNRFLISAIVFRLALSPEYVLDYPGVKEHVARTGPLSLQTLRRAIISIRQEKLPDPRTVGNAGSFFKNPLVDADTLQSLLSDHPGMPYFQQPANRFKIAAGWLIDRCGWRGKSLGRAAVHDQQALVLVNTGGAAGSEIFELSEQVKNSVRDVFGIELESEVVVVT